MDQFSEVLGHVNISRVRGCSVAEWQTTTCNMFPFFMSWENSCSWCTDRYHLSWSAGTRGACVDRWHEVGRGFLWYRTEWRNIETWFTWKVCLHPVLWWRIYQPHVMSQIFIYTAPLYIVAAEQGLIERNGTIDHFIFVIIINIYIIIIIFVATFIGLDSYQRPRSAWH